MNQKLKGSVCLLSAAIIWGSTFVAQSVGMDHIGPFTFLAARCFLAVLVLLPLIWYLDRRNGKNFWAEWKNPMLWRTGILCGGALFVASGLQQFGMLDTDAGKAGFITAMYIVLVPVLGVFLRKRPPVTVWISVAVAVCGLYLLSCTGASGFGMGDLFLMCCALAFAVQIILVDRYAGALDPIRFNCVQSLVCAVVCTFCMLLREQPTLEQLTACWLPIGYAGIMSMGVAFTLQIIGQKYVEPTASSLLLSLESVFAALSGWLILHETMTLTELTGCALVFAAVLLSQIPVRPRPMPVTEESQS